MIISFIEAVPDLKTLVARIKSDVRFKLSLEFLYLDCKPLEAAFSRILHILSDSRSSLVVVNNTYLKESMMRLIFSVRLLLLTLPLLKLTQNLK